MVKNNAEIWGKGSNYLPRNRNTERSVSRLVDRNDGTVREMKERNMNKIKIYREVEK